MKKTDFIKEFAKNAKLTQKDAREIAQVMGDMIIEHMRDEDGVTPFTGIKFVSVHKEAKTVRNPRNGEMVDVPAKYAPRAKFGKIVKYTINQ